MDTNFRMLASIIAMLANIELYMIVFIPRYNRKITKVIVISASVFGVILDFIALHILGISSAITSAILLPVFSSGLFYLISKYRDARFWFTVGFVQITVASTYLTAMLVAMLLNLKSMLFIVIEVMFFIIVLNAIKKLIKNFHYAIENIETGWGMLAFVTIIELATLFTVIYYPKLITERMEYIPVGISICVLICSTMVIFIRTIGHMNKIHIKEKEEELLKTKLALQKSQLELQDVYYKMAYIDALTELYNRASYEMKIKELINDEGTYKEICFIAFDINGLKKINDNQGHNMGDKLIRDAALVIAKTFGGISDVYRIGGDEFSVIICNASEIQIKKLLKEFDINVKIHNKISKLYLEVASGYSIITNEEVKCIEDVIINADKAMYYKKRTMKMANF